MTMSLPPQWSEDVAQAEWVKGRLDDPTAGTVSSIVPAGFDAYAKILHPVETPRLGDRLVRWIEVANWGGQVLTAQSQWLDVAMPEHRPRDPRPWRSQGPKQGTLDSEDARALAEIAQAHTGTPEQCWCCIWDGFGWWSRRWYAPAGHISPPPPSPIPIEAKEWARVHTRYRDYLLYEASLETTFMESIEALEGHSPNLWWPADRAWCVGTDIDDRATYVGGSRALVDALLQSDVLEAFDVDATESTRAELPPWLGRLIDRTVDELLSTRRASVETSIGHANFELDRPRRGRRGTLRYEADHDGRGSYGESPIGRGSSEELRRQVSHRVEEGLRSLAT
jgi:hypothetical protein